MFKRLIFVQGQTAQVDCKIRTRILFELEQNSQISLKLVHEECERIENLWYDTARIQERVRTKINTVKQKQH